jgi:transcriptional regulator with XRE-family HTH domain
VTRAHRRLGDDLKRLQAKQRRMELAMRLSEARIAVDKTQEQLAEELGISPAAVAQWENGTTSPRLDRLGEIAAALATTVAALYGEIAA